jgi:hypothetical protein
MTVNVRGRTIEIDDGLAREYERYFFEPAGEGILLAYFAADDTDISKHSDEELSQVANCRMDTDLSIWRKTK